MASTPSKNWTLSLKNPTLHLGYYKLFMRQSEKGISFYKVFKQNITQIYQKYATLFKTLSFNYLFFIFIWNIFTEIFCKEIIKIGIVNSLLIMLDVWKESKKKVQHRIIKNCITVLQRLCIIGKKTINSFQI